MIKKFLRSELGKGTMILFIMMNLFNFLNFLFHFSMGRLLGPAKYGILAVLMSLIYIYNVPAEAIQNIISRYTSRFNLNKEYGKIKFLMLKSLKKGLMFSSILFLFVGIFSIFLSKFLNINLWLIIFTNLFLFSSFSVPIIRGVLQGEKKFKILGASLIIESGLKLIIAVLLVILGFGVFGAIFGVLLGISLGLIFSVYFSKDILIKRKEKVYFKRIYSQSVPYFITMFTILLIFSLDIILAKRFFSAELAGQYAVLSMLGKMIFLGTIAISKAMFPLTSEKNDSNKDGSNLFKKSFFIVSFICAVVTAIFIFFPKILILILYGPAYIEMAPYLIYSGISFSFLSLSNLILIYSLSIGKLKKSYLLFIFVLIEITLLSVFNKNISQYIMAFMVSNIIIFIGSLFLAKIWKK